MMTALFIGRFQPFHLGHASVLYAMKKEGVEHVVIGVGSSQYSRTADNPFTFEERKKMIELTLADDPRVPSFEIIAIEDIHNPPQWVQHVDHVIKTSYDVVYSGNPIVQQLFRDAGAVVKAVQATISIDGSTIRHLIDSRDITWQQFVHPAVAAFIDKIDHS